jgi:hypothetical protein
VIERAPDVLALPDAVPAARAWAGVLAIVAWLLFRTSIRANAGAKA